MCVFIKVDFKLATTDAAQERKFCTFISTTFCPKCNHKWLKHNLYIKSNYSPFLHQNTKECVQAPSFFSEEILQSKQF